MSISNERLALRAALWLAVATTASAGPAVAEHADVRAAFDPARDAFAFANGLVWQYDTGVEEVETPPASAAGYDQRCSQMSRAARQFFYGARFDPKLPRLTDRAYAERIARVMDVDPRLRAPAERAIVFPGFADLHSFSAEYEDLLKDALGGKWRAYLQRGNWRMIFEFTPAQQRRTARKLFDDLESGHPPIVHLVRYPRVTVNHTMLLYAATTTPAEILFAGYDPNHPTRPIAVRYDRARARFELQPTFYWKGGDLSAYPVFDGWFH